MKLIGCTDLHPWSSERRITEIDQFITELLSITKTTTPHVTKCQYFIFNNRYSDVILLCPLSGGNPSADNHFLFGETKKKKIQYLITSLPVGTSTYHVYVSLYLNLQPAQTLWWLQFSIWYVGWKDNVTKQQLLKKHTHTHKDTSLCIKCPIEFRAGLCDEGRSSVTLETLVVILFKAARERHVKGRVPVPLYSLFTGCTTTE